MHYEVVYLSPASTLYLLDIPLYYGFWCQIFFNIIEVKYVNQYIIAQSPVQLLLLLMTCISVYEVSCFPLSVYWDHLLRAGFDNMIVLLSYRLHSTIDKSLFSVYPPCSQSYGSNV